MILRERSLSDGDGVGEHPSHDIRARCRTGTSGQVASYLTSSRVEQPYGVNRFSDLLASSEFEILASVPTARGVLSLLRKERVHHIDPVRRGIHVKLLCNARLVSTPGIMDELKHLHHAGVSIRLSEHIARVIAVFDQKFALLSSGDHEDMRTVDDERTVSVLHEHFCLLWRNSMCFGLCHDAPRSSVEFDDDVVRALRSGVIDEVAARELGLSVRTYRRRVGMMMQNLGARSRFEAGFLVQDARRRQV